VSREKVDKRCLVLGRRVLHFAASPLLGNITYYVFDKFMNCTGFNYSSFIDAKLLLIPVFTIQKSLYFLYLDNPDESVAKQRDKTVYQMLFLMSSALYYPKQTFTTTLVSFIIPMQNITLNEYQKHYKAILKAPFKCFFEQLDDNDPDQEASQII